MMEQDNHIQMSESFRVGSLLAMVGGFLDVYTYITRDHVFANAQTGNIVLMGLNLAKGEIVTALSYFLPVVAFAAGILLTECIRCASKNFNLLHWRQIVVLLETMLLLIPAFSPSGPWDVAVNILISFVCAVQMESFRKIKGHAVVTTMCTGNLRSAMEQIFQYIRLKDPAARKTIFHYYTIILFFIVGAVGGTYLTLLWGEKSIVCCSGLLAIAFVAMFARET